MCPAPGCGEGIFPDEGRRIQCVRPECQVTDQMSIMLTESPEAKQLTVQNTMAYHSCCFIVTFVECTWLDLGQNERQSAFLF